MTDEPLPYRVMMLEAYNPWGFLYEYVSIDVEMEYADIAENELDGIIDSVDFIYAHMMETGRIIFT